MHLRDATESDLKSILEINNHATRELTASWTEVEDTLEGRGRWFAEQKKANRPVIVAVDEGGGVAGFGSYSPYRPKDGYRMTTSHSVYVTQEYQGRGVGSQLLSELIARARGDGLHVMVAGIDGENAASVALHSKLGFEVTGRLPQVGAKFGRWLDLIIMTLVLNDHPAPPAK